MPFLREVQCIFQIGALFANEVNGNRDKFKDRIPIPELGE